MASPGLSGFRVLMDPNSIFCPRDFGQDFGRGSELPQVRVLAFRSFEGFAMRFELVVAAVSLAIFSGCSIGKFEHTRTENQSLAPGNLDVIDVSTFNGSVSVVAHDSAEVEVQIDYSARGESIEEAETNCDALGCEITDADGRLVLKATRPASDYSAAAAMILKVPRFCKIAVQTSNGEIIVEGINGDLDLTSSNGRIEVDNVEGALDLTTSNGRIEMVNCTGPIDVSTSNGRIEFDGMLTGNNNEISTSNGGVQVMLDSSVFVEITAETSNGSVSCDAEHAMLKQDDDYLKAIVGAGAAKDSVPLATLDIGSSNGSISIGAASLKTIEEEADE